MNDLDLITQERELNLPDIKEIKRDSTEDEVLEADATRAEVVLKALYSAWSSVKTVHGICKLAETTMSTMERRRKLLCMAYGAEPKKSSGNTVYPLD